MKKKTEKKEKVKVKYTWSGIRQAPHFNDAVHMAGLFLFWILIGTMHFASLAYPGKESETVPWTSPYHWAMVALSFVLLVFVTLVFVDYCKRIKKHIAEVQRVGALKHDKKYRDDIIWHAHDVGVEIYNAVVAWKNECNVKMVMLDVKRDRENNTEKLVVYTDKPGVMIGVHGKTIDKYRKQICSATRMHKFDDVEICEVAGLVSADERVNEQYYWDHNAMMYSSGEF